jgi:RHS repeat-associated protein
VRVATTTTGAVTDQWQWLDNAFGDRAMTGSSDYYLSFPGQYYDVETGLHYNGRRYYDPSIGKYIQSDPIGLIGGVDTYAYVENLPLEMIDANGLSPQEVLAVPQEWINTMGDIAAETADEVPDIISEPANESAPIQPVDQVGAFSETQSKDYERYHEECDKPPPPTDNPCDKKKWQLQQARLCRQLRQDYTNKYFDGKYDSGHQQYMDNLDKRIDRLEDWIRRFCPPGSNLT